MTDQIPDPGSGEPQLPDALLRALLAPGTTEELAGESEVLAAFRAARPAPGPRLRVVGRLGAGGAALAATVVLGSGVAAAAYTSSLPEPVQQLAHRVLAPIGVPAAPPRHHRPRPTLAAPVTTRSPGTGSTGPASPAPTSPHSRRAGASPSVGTPTGAPTGTPRPTASATPAPVPSGTPSASPTGSPTSTPTGSPTSTPSASPTGSPTSRPSRPPRPVAASVSLALSANRVAAGSTVRATVSALDATGRPVAKQRIALQASTGAGWLTVATGVTDRAGTVSLFSPAITQNTRFRVRLTSPALTGPVLSAVARVSETPELIATFENGALRISAVGAQPGDTLRIGLVQGGVLTPVGTAFLADAAATFAVQQTSSQERFVIVLPRTPKHAGARTSVVVPRLSGR